MDWHLTTIPELATRYLATLPIVGSLLGLCSLRDTSSPSAFSSCSLLGASFLVPELHWREVDMEVEEALGRRLVLQGQDQLNDNVRVGGVKYFCRLGLNHPLKGSNG